MIDLGPYIRDDILAQPFAVDIGDYLNSKSVVTRRPVPDAAGFPVVIISPQITSFVQDFINTPIRDLVYDIAVYGRNGTAQEYRSVETLAYDIARRYLRLNSFGIEVPDGYHLVKAVGTGPIIAPTDDETTVGRLITVTFTIQKEN